MFDVQAGKEVAVFSDIVPIGPGPKGSMVLVRAQSAKIEEKQSRILIHQQIKKSQEGKLTPLGDESVRPISTQGKWLLFIRKDKDGKETVRLAEIKLP